MAYIIEERISKDNFFEVEAKDRLFFMDEILIQDLYFQEDVRAWLFEVFQEGLESGALFREDALADKLIDALAPALIDPKFAEALRQGFSNVFEKVPEYSPPYNAIKSILISCLDEDDYPELKEWAQKLLEKRENFSLDSRENYLIKNLENENNALSVRKEAALALGRISSPKALETLYQQTKKMLTSERTGDLMEETIYYHLLNVLVYSMGLAIENLYAKKRLDFEHLEKIEDILKQVKSREHIDEDIDKDIKKMATLSLKRLNDVACKLAECQFREYISDEIIKYAQKFILTFVIIWHLKKAYYEMQGVSAATPKEGEKEKVFIDDEYSFQVCQFPHLIYIELKDYAGLEMPSFLKIKIYTSKEDRAIIEESLRKDEKDGKLKTVIPNLSLKEIKSIQVIERSQEDEAEF